MTSGLFSPRGLRSGTRLGAARRGFWMKTSWGRPATGSGFGALVVAGLVVLAACTSDDGGSSDKTGSTAESKAAGADVPDVAAGSFEDMDCPENVVVTSPVTVRCGTLTTPERHAEPDGRTVTLPVAVLEPPEVAAADPVVFLDGGPGGDGLSAAEPLSELPVAQDRSVIIIGQRGTPLAEPSFDCPEFEEAEARLYDQDLATPEAEAAVADAEAACFERVSADNPALEAYDSVAAADDLEAARLALGYDEWNLYGVSYGTRLALEAVRRHPDGLRSVVLDSTYPPEVDGYASLVPNAERAFDELGAACDSDPGCADAYPDLIPRIAALYDRLEAEPVDHSVDHPVTGQPTTVRWDGDRTVGAAFLALYDPALIPLMPSLLKAFEEGDFSLATPTYLEGLEGAASTLAEGLFSAVQCRERAPFADTTELARQRDEEPGWLIAATAPEGPEGLGVCDIWEIPPASADVTEPVRGDVPTLVLAGQFDPVTPPAWGRQTADAQDTAWFYEFPGYSHVVSFDPCADDIVSDFLADPTTEPDAACIDTLGPPAWILPD